MDSPHKAMLRELCIEVPSWAFGNSGTIADSDSRTREDTGAGMELLADQRIRQPNGLLSDVRLRLHPNQTHTVGPEPVYPP